MTDDLRGARRTHPSAFTRGADRRDADRPRRAPALPTSAGASFIVSCDDCVMQCTAACGDCVVTFVLRDDVEEEVHHLELDHDQVRAVRLLAKAGLVPELRYELAG